MAALGTTADCRFFFLSKVNTFKIILGACAAVIICMFAAGLHASEKGGDNTGDYAPLIPDSRKLEDEGAVIGKITYKILDIFNTEIPEEDKTLYRLANNLHIRTHQSVIGDQLLFHTGDQYSEQMIAETERILRANRYIQDVSIYPTAYHDGVVDLAVTTRDVWTLHPGASFGRKGGDNSSEFEIEDTNFLGSGVKLSIAQRNTVDRTGNSIQYSDNQIFGSWWKLGARFGDNSDGYEKTFAFDHPFYSLDTHAAGGLTASDNLLTKKLYNRGEVIEEFEQSQEFLDVYGGWSVLGLLNNWAKRWTVGLTYDDNVFVALPETINPTAIPGDRKLVYPWVAYEIIENDYLKIRNHDQIGRIEDIFLGTHVYAKLGYASTAYGADRDAWIFSATVEKGVSDGIDRNTLLLRSDISGRFESGKFANALLTQKVSYYRVQSDVRLLYAGLQLDYAHQLDAENQLLIGGDSGLRGYPLRYQYGNKRALFTVEERLYTNWYPFRLFRVGGAVFFDAGRAWGGSAMFDEGDHPVLKDIGFGLRLGNTRSGRGNLIHLDLAFPLDGDSSIDSMQFLIESKASF